MWRLGRYWNGNVWVDGGDKIVGESRLSEEGIEKCWYYWLTTQSRPRCSKTHAYTKRRSLCAVSACCKPESSVRILTSEIQDEHEVKGKCQVNQLCRDKLCIPWIEAVEIRPVTPYILDTYANATTIPLRHIWKISKCIWRSGPFCL